MIEITGMTKSYGAIRALNAVDFNLKSGEVMALLGENGAGKSTLVKILAGLVKPDAGEISILGEPAELYPAARSEAAGIAVVQQELSLVPTMSAAENVFLGNTHIGRWQTPARMRRLAEPYLERVGLADRSARVASALSVAEKQLVEVARLLAREARIFLFDEPTAALADAEIERVHQVVRTLVAADHAVIYVTHRLAEVFEIADRVTVLREGESFPPVEVSELDMGQVVELMLGRALENMYPERSSGVSDVVLEADGIRTDGLAHPVSLQVREGEILGLVGQMGSGTTPVLEALGGARRLRGGAIRVHGEPVELRHVRDAMRHGVGYCSGDRKGDGLFLIRPVDENLVAPALDRITPGGWLSSRKERQLSEEIASFFTIDDKRLSHRADTLSGGNQQKVALGKWVGIEPKVLLVDEPTRGVDVGARAEIYSHLRRLAEQGLAIVFASSDGQEVLGLADTVATFYRGSLINVTPREHIDAKQVLVEVTHPEAREEAV
jgi:ribose transport system ATP-binding protein/rhamnose transport system ATP-binding protein